jgi:hypothetical protein
MMHHTAKTALITLASALSIASGCAPVDGDELGESVQAITNTSLLRSPSEFGLAAIGVERNGVVTPRCTAAFLYNDWLLTHRRCVEGVAWGSRLVATNAIDVNVAYREIAPWPTRVEWVRVTESSGLSFDPELAMVRLERAVATGRRDDVTATGGFARTITPTTRPITSTTDLRCFGFSFTSGRLALGHRLVRVAAPGSRVVTVRAGFGETADSADDGGACLVPDNTLAGVLRFRDSTSWDLVDFTRSPSLRGEIADAYRGSAMAESLGLWPLTLNSVTSGRNVVVRLNGVGGYATLTEAVAPIWAQGFMNVQLASTASTTDVQLRHRGTGYCVSPRATGFSLESCLTNPGLTSTQRLRVFYLGDGSVQVLSTALGQCLTESNGQVVLRACNTATPGQRWFQGFGRR